MKIISPQTNKTESRYADLLKAFQKAGHIVIRTTTSPQIKDELLKGAVLLTESQEHTSDKLGLNHQNIVGLGENRSNTRLGQALDKAYSQLLKNRHTLMLSNIHDSDESSVRSLIITPEKGIKPVSNIDLLPKAFNEVLQSRINNYHFKTKLVNQRLPESINDDLDEVIRNTKKWSQWSLFPKYELKEANYPGAEFGFVAKRTDAGTLITARGSNKEDPSAKDFTLIERIDDDNTIHVKSTGKKASLNGPLAHYIFARRPEIKYVIHSHIFIPEGSNASAITSPGTQKDWQSIESLVNSGVKIINQPLHGSLILLEKPDELLEILKRNSLYKQNSELYDLAYARFQSNAHRETSLEKTIKALNLPRDSSVLDLCCGTGASTKALQILGFSNIDIADGSRSMLNVAESRLDKVGTIIDLPNLDKINKQYDLITMRQAFNYVSPEDLSIFANSIATKLNRGGKFVFNTFGPLESGIKTTEPEDYEDGQLWVRTRETNTITPATVLHSQRSEIVDFNRDHWHAVLDINEFYQHDLDQIVSAFKGAGLEVGTYNNDNSFCFTCTKP